MNEITAERNQVIADALDPQVRQALGILIYAAEEQDLRREGDKRPD